MKQRAVLLNDTSVANHYGCRAVVSAIRDALAERGIALSASAPVGSRWWDDSRFLAAMADADLILVNGEGTLHHGATHGDALLSVVEHPARGFTPVALINALYQDNPPHWADRLSKFALISVRDTRSQAELHRLGIDASFAPDLSLYRPPVADPAERRYRAFGDSVYKNVSRELYLLYRRNPGPKIYLSVRSTIRHAPLLASPTRRQSLANLRHAARAHIHSTLDRGLCITRSFDQFCATLASASIYITGRYHGVCLALLHDVPVLSVSSNSYKTEALLSDAGLNVARVAGSFSDLENIDSGQWEFSGQEKVALQGFLAEARRRNDALFDRLCEL